MSDFQQDEPGFKALLLLGESGELMPEALEDVFADAAPRSALQVEEMPRGDAVQVLSVTVDGHSIDCSMFDGQIDDPSVGQAAGRSVFWSGAAEQVAGHRGYLVVSAAERQASHGLARAQAVAMTRLLAVLAEGLPARGVYWCDAETVSSPGRIVQAVQELDQGHWPVDVWLGYERYGATPEAPAVAGLRTRGGGAFFGFEIDVLPFHANDAEEPMRILNGAARYLMNFGNVIKNGQVVRMEGQRRFTYQLERGGRGKPGVARLTVADGDKGGRGVAAVGRGGGADAPGKP